MKNNIYIILIFAFSLFSIKSYAGGACSPVTTNGSCATGTALTPGASCITGTTCQGGGEVANSCLFAGSECSWYSFVATGAAMFVDIGVTSTDGCNISSNVYAATGFCVGVEISCLAGAPLDDLHSLTGLTIGNTYYVQVCYSPGGPCGNGGKADYCIRVGVPDPLCNTCGAPCGTAEGYPAPPLTATVVADCQTTPFSPQLLESSTNTFCYDFTAASVSIDFNVIITSDCGGGNVTNFTWSLFDITCGASIQTGTLANLTFAGLTINNNYVFCYTFDVPAGCSHTQHCPYFVGAEPLPIQLTSFTAEAINNSTINLDWVTASEINNDFFTIERSTDANIFEVVGIVDGAGNSNAVLSYDTKDKNPYKGISYYRLKQTDFDGKYEYSKAIAVTIESSFDGLNVFPNPVEGLGYLSFKSNANDIVNVVIYDYTGKKITSKQYSATEGANKFELPTADLSQGMYFLTIGNNKEIANFKFIKQ